MDVALNLIREFRHAFNAYFTPKLGIGCSYSNHVQVFDKEHPNPVLFQHESLLRLLLQPFFPSDAHVEDYMEKSMINPGHHIFNYGDVIIISFLCCVLVNILSRIFSPIFSPQTYGKLLNRNERRDWDSRFANKHMNEERRKCGKENKKKKKNRFQ